MGIFHSSDFDMSSLEQRENIKFYSLLEKSPSKTFKMQKKAYGKYAMKNTAVYKYSTKYFHKGSTNIKDDLQTGGPCSSTADENVKRNCTHM